MLKFTKDIGERGWVSGLYDGEGCTHAYAVKYTNKAGITRSYLQPKIAITQKDDRVLRRLNKAVGYLGNITRSSFTSAHRNGPMHQLQIDGYEKVMTVVAFMWPYLDEIKREQAKDVLQRCVAEFRSRSTEAQNLSKLVMGNRNNKTRLKPGPHNSIVA